MGTPCSQYSYQTVIKSQVTLSIHRSYQKNPAFLLYERIPENLFTEYTHGSQWSLILTTSALDSVLRTHIIL